MLHAFLVVLALCQPAGPASEAAVLPARAALAQGGTVQGQPSLATFIPICRDSRGTWDRRACRHVRRSDPARLTLA